MKPFPLENGDHLSRAEFERRYEAMPQVKKAELLEGKVFMPSPVRIRNHAGPHGKLLIWLGFYVMGTPGVDLADNGSVRLDDENEPQPDGFLYVVSGGQGQIDEDDYFAGAPEWAGEVSASTVSYDLHEKVRVYRRHGVKEYVVWRVLDKEIDWFVLRGDQYERLPLLEDRLYKSEVFPGLWLDPQALIAEDLPKLQAVVQRGLASAEHQAFVERLAQQASTASGER
jgi:Uma2 family endonuclease